MELKQRVDALELRPYSRKEIDNYSLFEFWVCSSVNIKKVYYVSCKLHYDGLEEWHCDCHDYTFKYVNDKDYKCKHILKCRELLIKHELLDKQ